MEMSFSEALRRYVLLSIAIALIFGLFVAFISGGENLEAAFIVAFFVFIVVFLFSLLNISNAKCPKCKKYECFTAHKTEDLSRDVVSKRVKDNELGTKLEHYAVGKRKHYYKCNKCGYESTSIKDYKDKIDV